MIRFSVARFHRSGNAQQLSRPIERPLHGLADTRRKQRVHGLRWTLGAAGTQHWERDRIPIVRRTPHRTTAGVSYLGRLGQPPLNTKQSKSNPTPLSPQEHLKSRYKQTPPFCRRIATNNRTQIFESNTNSVTARRNTLPILRNYFRIYWNMDWVLFYNVFHTKLMEVKHTNT